MGAQPVSKRDGNLYLSVEGDTVNGIAFFNVKGVLFISYETEAIFQKVDFLKAIHREQPRQIRGQRQQVSRIFTFLQRILKDYAFHNMQVMALLDKSPTLSAPSIPEGLELVDAYTIDWLANGKFLLAVEQHFRAHTLTINNLRHKIHQRQEFEFYWVLSAAERVRAQIIAEFATDHTCVIGGLYVLPSERGHGLAKSLCLASIQEILRANKTPALYVADDNKEAIELYQRLGFTRQAEMLDLNIKLQ